MELLQLRYFCDAAKTLNLSKTARKYTVPPSNISQSVKRLERELGYPLFIRHANKIVLSELGEKFYKKISRALDLIDDAALSKIDDGTKGSISISINSNRRIVMETIESFKKEYPNVNIKTAYFGNLEEEDFNIIIDSGGNVPKGYHKEILLTEDIDLAVNADSPLAKLESIDVKMLQNEPFITMDGKASMCKLTKEICSYNGFEPRIALQSDDPSFVRKCVEVGLGIAFSPSLSWRGQFSENVVLKKLDYKRDIHVYLSKKISTPICVKNFLEALKKTFESLKK